MSGLSAVSGAHASPRRFWQYWVASSLSGLGLSITSVAFPLVAVVTLNASPFELGATAAASSVGWLVLGLPAGAIADRFALRRVQIGMDVSRLIVVAGVVVLWASGQLNIWWILLAGVLVSCADVLFDVANATYLPSIIDDDEFERRNSLLSATHAAASTGGPALGGAVAGLIGPVLALGTTGVGYLISALLFARLPSTTRSAEAGRARTYRAMVAEGIRFVFRHPVLRPTTILAAVLNFAIGAQAALFAVFLVRELEVPVAAVGALLAFDGFGALIGAAIATRVFARIGSARTTLWAAWVTTAGCILVGMAAPGWGIAVFVGGSFLVGAGAVIVSIATRSYRQRATSPELLGRVMATVRFISWGCVPLGGFLAGLLAQSTSARVALIAVGAACAAAPLVFRWSSVGRSVSLSDARDRTDA